MLAPLSLAVEAMCRRDANLLTADTTLSFMLSQLDKLSDTLACDLKNALVNEIKKRRTSSSSLLQYLHNGYRADFTKYPDIFTKLNKSTICKMLVDLVERLTDTNDTSNVDNESDGAISLRYSDDEDAVEI